MPMELRRPARTFTIRQLCLEFKCTPRALRFYEDKGLLAPARDGMNRVYSYKDRGRLQLILNGKRVGLALAEIGEILDLYDLNDGGTAQNVKSLTKFRERIVALEAQRQDIDKAIEELRAGCDGLERQLSRTRPDLLPRAADYDQVLRERLGDLEHAK
ncbi:MerR family DNA-binding transcriptional regulator [soil metagenome]|uniref:MerR family DNA-binding transcriptional regulator n=1 Tax=Phenylobacterium glaciei TaxID=2803784 RepID=A0A941HUN8_9CAUL|nr:MerR family DNA-binding transcriptional regulator [Phenylobacterium glaciei]MBR7617793.1 MerR family DNA-binding transcriptional regulator [Phenylobacterium glaciei]QQZ50445.1 MerR family DNA-binding transcriptional regulator [Phenylobacterium glaciei]